MIGEHRDADDRARHRDELVVTTDRSSTGLVARRRQPGAPGHALDGFASGDLLIAVTGRAGR